VRTTSIGIQLDHQSQGSESLSIGGLSENLARRQVLAFNTVTNGGGWVATLTDATVLIGNVVAVNSTTNIAGAFLGQDVRNNMLILANIFNVDVSSTTIVPFTLLSTSTSSLQVLISNNLIRSVNGGAAGNGAVLTSFQYTGDNLLIGGTTASVILPPSNKDITLAGSAGPGTRIADITLAAGPATHVAAVAGSVCCNPSGGVATTLFVKESGSGLSGGASGWFCRTQPSQGRFLS
jgi:hypothetical protein